MSEDPHNITDEDPYADLEAVMQELPGGDNNGRAAWMGGDTEGFDSVQFAGSAAASDQRQEFDGSKHKRELSARGMQIAHFLSGREGHGWGIVDPNQGTAVTGMTAHRGVLPEGQYVDTAAFGELLAEHFGFTLADIEAIYSRAGGPLPAAMRAQRDKMDAALLALSRDGANMTVFCEHTALSTAGLQRALDRAKAAEVTS